MKKIGILFGQENTFPQAFVDRINEKKVKGISAEFAYVAKVFQARDFVEGFEVGESRLCQRINRLLAKEEERAEAELMTERAIHGIDGAGGHLGADLHQRGREHGQTHVE